MKLTSLDPDRASLTPSAGRVCEGTQRQVEFRGHSARAYKKRDGVRQQAYNAGSSAAVNSSARSARREDAPLRETLQRRLAVCELITGDPVGFCV